MKGLWSDLSAEVRKISIKETVYVLVATFLTLILLLVCLAVYSARGQHAYHEKLDISARAALNIERVNALIYAAVMESRGIYMSTDRAKAKSFGDSLLKRNREIEQVVAEWEQIVSDDDAAQFAVFKKRIDQFVGFRDELVRRARAIDPAAGREWGDNDANRTVRTALNEDLEALAKVYASRAKDVAELGKHGELVSWYLIALGIAAMAMAAFVALLILKSIVRPLSDITQTTDRIASGKIKLAIPHINRQDEIGHLARAVWNFQDAVGQIEELQEHNLALEGEREVVAKARDSLEDRFHTKKWQLDAAINNMAQGLIMLDRSGGIVLVNDQYRKMYRLPAEVIRPGCSLKDILKHRAQIGLFTGDIDGYMSMILTRIAERKPAVHDIELADGRIISVSERAMDGGGWVATHQDITIQRQVMKALERTEQFLATVIENVPEAIIAKRARDLKYVFVNRAAEILYGLPRSEIIEKTAHDLFPKQTAELIERHDKQLLAENREIEAGTHTIETPGNGVRIVSVKRLPIAGKDGGSHFLLSMIEDHTHLNSSAA